MDSTRTIRLTEEEVTRARTYAAGVAGTTNWHYTFKQQEVLAFVGTTGEMAALKYVSSLNPYWKPLKEQVEEMTTVFSSSAGKSHGADLLFVAKGDASLRVIPVHVKTFRLWEEDTKLPSGNRARTYEPAWLFNSNSIKTYSSTRSPSFSSIAGHSSKASRKLRELSEQCPVTVDKAMIALVVSMTPDSHYIAWFGEWESESFQSLIGEFHSFSTAHRDLHSYRTLRLGMSDLMTGKYTGSATGDVWFDSNLCKQLIPFSLRSEIEKNKAGSR